MDKTLCLWINVRGSGYSVRFNDMIVTNSLVSNSPARTIPIHEYVLQGKNQLCVCPIWTVKDLMQVSSSRFQRSSVSNPIQIEVKLLLIKDRGANTLVEPQTLQSWSKSIEPYDLRIGMKGLEVEIDLPFTFPRWRWADLTISTMGLENVELLVKERIAQMCQWVDKGEEDQFLRQFNVKVEEYSKAYGLDIAETVSHFKRSIGLKDFRLKLADISREFDQLRLLTCRNESVVFPVNDSGEPFFQLHDHKNKITYRLDMHFAAFGENIYVVR